MKFHKLVLLAACNYWFWLIGKCALCLSVLSCFLCALGALFLDKFYKNPCYVTMKTFMVFVVHAPPIVITHGKYMQ